jgi:hypothetical protein
MPRPVESAPANRESVRVLYIVGWGHSGSTLLDLAVGAAPNAVSVGEVIFFNFFRDRQRHAKILNELVCTCGSRFDSCEFWTRVLEAPRQRPFEVVYDESTFDRIRWIFRLIGWVLRGRRSDRAAEAFGDDAELFHRVLAVAGDGTELICDSSKDFARLARLAMNPRIDLHAIHLVRDGRGVAYSYTKRWRTEAGLNSMGFFRAMVNWVGVNLVSRFVLLLAGCPRRTIHYEDFCSDPGSILEELDRWLGLRISRDGVVGRINATTYHNLGGNPLRFEPIEEIRLDESWRRAVGPWARRLAGALVRLTNPFWPADPPADAAGRQ